MRSVRGLGLIGVGLTLTVLAGCATTQQQAARLQLNSARIRATELPLRVVRRDPRVRLVQIALVRGSAGAALVVALRNPTSTSSSDLPISVGITTAHRRRLYLNAAPGIDYFQTHAPPIAAGGTLTWVFTTARRLPAAAHPFAEVGAPTLTPAPVYSPLPRIDVATATRRGRDVQLTVHNESSVPQYQLQVYAVALSAGRYIAAGTASIAQLGASSSSGLRIRLLGSAGRARLALQAPPTIFG